MIARVTEWSQETKSLSPEKTGKQAVEVLLRWISHAMDNQPNKDFLSDLANVFLHQK